MANTQNNMNGDFLRKPPASVEAEQALLSAIITNNSALEKVSEFLLPEHFVEEAHKKIYEACKNLIEKGHLADIITLKIYLTQRGELEAIGGIDYLYSLANNAVSIINAVDYGKLIYDCAIKRNLISIGTDIVNTAFGGIPLKEEVSGENQIQIAEQKLYDLASSGSATGGPQDFRTALDATREMIQTAYQSDGSISGISTGFDDLDKKIGGLHPSDLIIIAGRPGMGKTTFALNIAFNVANEVFNDRAPKKLHGPALFFSLEMSSEQLATRILSSSAEVSGHKIRNGNISEDEFNRITEHSRALDTLPLYVDDAPDLTVSAIRTRARRLKRQHGLSVILIDYIQLLNSPSGRKSENRVQEISEMTRGLKMLAKELDVPVIALSQLSRSVESRDDKKPQLSDLRESGSIEQDADMVMFVYREAYYIENRPPKDEQPGSTKYLEWQSKLNRYKNMAEILIEKQRHGTTGSVFLSYVGEYSRFGNFYNGTDPNS